LGPFFKGRSCAACHHPDGLRGAGGNESSVLLLSLTPPDESLSVAEQRDVFARLSDFHAEIANRSSVIVRHPGTGAQFAVWRDDDSVCNPTPLFSQSLKVSEIVVRSFRADWVWLFDCLPVAASRSS
jgi:hypothetical protein